jgi:hypothetical protein
VISSAEHEPHLSHAESVSAEAAKLRSLGVVIVCIHNGGSKMATGKGRRNMAYKTLRFAAEAVFPADGGYGNLWFVPARAHYYAMNRAPHRHSKSDHKRLQMNTQTGRAPHRKSRRAAIRAAEWRISQTLANRGLTPRGPLSRAVSGLRFLFSKYAPSSLIVFHVLRSLPNIPQ